MQASVIDRPLSHFVGLRVCATTDTVVDAQNSFRKTLLARQFEINGIVNAYQQLGVTRPNETEATDESVTTYLGFEVSAYKDVPQDMVCLELAPGRYGQFVFKGSLNSDEYDGFYPSIFGWLQQQSLAPSQTHPWIEVYGTENDWDNRSDPNNEVTVLLPLGGPSFR
jgi:predicted transcriptional regulator YdeE